MRSRLSHSAACSRRGRRAARGPAFTCLLVVLSLALAAGAIKAAATLLEFRSVAQQQQIDVLWSTSSESGNLGFFVWRSTNRDTDYLKLPLGSPLLVPSEGQTGADYSFPDRQATPGITYYYRLEDVPESGSGGAFSAAVSAMISPLSPIATPTPEPALGTLITFSADPAVLTAGECSTLRWEVIGAEAVYLDGVAVAATGSRVLCLCASETHTLAAQYPNGAQEGRQLMLTVTGRCTARGAQPTATMAPVAPTATLERPLVFPTATVGPVLLSPVFSSLPTPAPDAYIFVSPLYSELAAPSGSYPLWERGNLLLVEGAPAPRGLPSWILIMGAGVGVALIAVGGVAIWKES